MAWALLFAEYRVAAENHRCNKCRRPIWKGSEYHRSAIPPWGHECRDDEGNRVRYSIGEWEVIKVCGDCLL